VPMAVHHERPPRYPRRLCLSFAGPRRPRDSGGLCSILANPGWDPRRNNCSARGGETHQIAPRSADRVRSQRPTTHTAFDMPLVKDFVRRPPRLLSRHGQRLLRLPSRRGGPRRSRGGLLCREGQGVEERRTRFRCGQGTGRSAAMQAISRLSHCGSVGTGPGGHCGASEESSGVDLPPNIDTSDQPLPGRATTTLRPASAPRKTNRERNLRRPVDNRREPVFSTFRTPNLGGVQPLRDAPNVGG